MEMQHSSRSSSKVSETDVQQPRVKWIALFNRLCDDFKVTQVMNSGVGQYLSSHPFLALAGMLFSTMAAVPVGLFLAFALGTIIMSAVGFVFCEGFLLFIAGLTLLSVLSGLALFAVLVSFIVSGFYLIIFNVLKYYRLIKQGKVQEKSASETSELCDTQ